MACLVGLVFVPGCPQVETGTVFSPPGTTTTIIIVRHAERDDGYDPPLNETGLVRAEALADELEDANIATIFYPNFIRNVQTAEPLVERTGAEVRVYTQLEAGNTKALADTFLNEVITDHAGEVVLWIGNTGPEIEGIQSGNLQEIYARLGGTGTPPIQYTSLYTIILHDDGPPTITEDSYFVPQPETAPACDGSRVLCKPYASMADTRD